MTRKDIIIVAVLVNLAMLAILFMLAFRDEEDKNPEKPTISYAIEESQPMQILSENTNEKPEILDEGDSFLSELSVESTSSNFSQEDEDEVYHEEKSSLHDEPSFEQSYFVEVTVKRGDVLEKIAKTNGTTVEAIKKVNQLNSDRLKIGQILKVPVGTAKKSQDTLQASTSTLRPVSGPQLYVIKSGDNPWKIAKQFHMRVDELLKLNDLNEESARNLKIGDQIKVR